MEDPAASERGRRKLADFTPCSLPNDGIRKHEKAAGFDRPPRSEEKKE